MSTSSLTLSRRRANNVDQPSPSRALINDKWAISCYTSEKGKSHVAIGSAKQGTDPLSSIDVAKTNSVNAIPSGLTAMVTPRSTGRSSPVIRRGESDLRAKDQWWEGVLPPGQLAERLRRAQTGASADFSTHSHDPSRSPHRSTLRSSAELRPTPRNSSRRNHLSTASSADHHTASPTYLSPTNVNTGLTRPHTTSSVPLPSFPSSFQPSSTRSSMSIGDSSSASSSNDEGSAHGHHSPVLADEWHAYSGPGSERGSGATSPTASITRSQSSRRRRVLATDESGVGLGVNIRGAKNHVVDLDERFRQWNDGVLFHHLPGQQPNSGSNTIGADLRPFPTAHASRSHFPTASASVFDTPDHSSEEDRGSIRTTRRPVRTSSTRSIDTVREGVEMRRGFSSRTSAPTSRRSSLNTGSHPAYANRRVSFNQDVEVVQPNETKSTQTIGRAQGRTISSLSQQRKSGSASTNAWYSTWQPQRDEDVAAHAHSHVRGKRMPCHSAPTSPKLSHAPFPFASRQRKSSSLATGSEAGFGSFHGIGGKYETSSDAATSAAEMAVLSSLSAAQTQFRSAGSLALALTRQLSAPLRPFLHLTLFASISSMALMALAGFLVAGYLCTVWDDVNDRGKSLQKNVNTARTSIEKRIQWTRSVLGLSNAESDSINKPTVSSTGKSNVRTEQSAGSTTKTPTVGANSTSASATRFITAPIRFAFALPSTILALVTPAGVRLAYSGGAEQTTRGSASHGKRRSAGGGGGHRHTTSAPASSPSGFSNLPPRPPLSSLLPSIAFTIVIACGAGLASFFANRAAADTVSPTSSARATPNSSAPPSPSHHHARSASEARYSAHAGAFSSASSSGTSSPYRRRSNAHSMSGIQHVPAAGLAHHVNLHPVDSGRRSPIPAAIFSR